MLTQFIGVQQDITARREREREQDGSRGFRVRLSGDDGPGLPETEPEVPETGGKRQLAHGGGLCLWMVRTLVTVNGADIEVDTTAEGTTIRLLLLAN